MSRASLSAEFIGLWARICAAKSIKEAYRNPIMEWFAMSDIIGTSNVNINVMFENSLRKFILHDI